MPGRGAYRKQPIDVFLSGSKIIKHPWVRIKKKCKDTGGTTEIRSLPELHLNL